MACSRSLTGSDYHRIGVVDTAIYLLRHKGKVNVDHIKSGLDVWTSSPSASEYHRLAELYWVSRCVMTASLETVVG